MAKKKASKKKTKKPRKLKTRRVARRPARKAKAPARRKAAPRQRKAKAPAPAAAAAVPQPAPAPQEAHPAEAHKEPVLPWRQPLPGETKLGVVDDYFGHLGVIAFKLEQPLSMGQKIHVRGHTTDLVQAAESMQLGHQSVTTANPGDSVGIKVNVKCRAGDYVYLCA